MAFTPAVNVDTTSTEEIAAQDLLQSGEEEGQIKNN